MDFGYSLMNFSVLQRNAENCSEHNIYGKCIHDGVLLLSVSSASGVEWKEKEIGTAAKGRFSGIISGLPTGGPYTMKFAIRNADGKRFEKCSFCEVMVGDLWLMGGQSNMLGSAYLPAVVSGDSAIHNFYMDGRWAVAKEPLHNVLQAMAPVHGGNPSYKLPKHPVRGAGLGISFARTMLEITGIPQGTIACAHGGTSMAQWSPDLLNLGSNSLYGAMIEVVRLIGGKIAGLLWYQGCDDTTPEKSLLFEKNFRKLIKAVRKDTGQPELPIVFAQLATHVNPDAAEEAWTRVRDAQFRIGQSVKNTACVPTIDLPLDDVIHLSALAQAMLGKRFASAMLNLKQTGTVLPEIIPGPMRTWNDPACGCLVIALKFKNLRGNLTAQTQPGGFYLIPKNGGKYCGCFKVELSGDQAIIHTSVFPTQGGDYLLAYGAGSRPFANITDEANRSLPCFVLPIRLSRNIVEMKFVEEAEVSDPVYIDESLDALQLPQTSLSWRKAAFSRFILMHPERKALATQEAKVFYFRFKSELPEDMDLKVLVGADGPFALFCDGKEIMRKATVNPVTMDEFKLKIKLPAGLHEWIFAVSSNAGNTWGVCCRLVNCTSRKQPILKMW